MERKKGLPPVHPGEIIKGDILPSAGLSVTAAAKALGVSRQMLHDILAERRPLSAVMCLVSRLFGSSPEVWMRLQPPLLSQGRSADALCCVRSGL